MKMKEEMDMNKTEPSPDEAPKPVVGDESSPRTADSSKKGPKSPKWVKFRLSSSKSSFGFMLLSSPIYHVAIISTVWNDFRLCANRIFRSKAKPVILLPPAEPPEVLLPGCSAVAALSKAVCVGGASVRDVALYDYIACLKHQQVFHTFCYAVRSFYFLW